MYRFFAMLLLLLILLNTCMGCTYFVEKETIQVIDNVLESTPNPDKKKKIIKKQKTLKEKSREFYCSKVKDAEKCDNVQ